MKIIDRKTNKEDKRFNKKWNLLLYLRQGWFKMCAPCNVDGRIAEKIWNEWWNWNIIVNIIECLQCAYYECTLIHSIQSHFPLLMGFFEAFILFFLFSSFEMILYVCLWINGFFPLLHFKSICFEYQKVWMVECLMIEV